MKLLATPLQRDLLEHTAMTDDYGVACAYSFKGFPAAELWEMAIVSCSTKLARLHYQLKIAGLGTRVEQLSPWTYQISTIMLHTENKTSKRATMLRVLWAWFSPLSFPEDGNWTYINQLVGPTSGLSIFTRREVYLTMLIWITRRGTIPAFVALKGSYVERQDAVKLVHKSDTKKDRRFLTVPDTEQTIVVATAVQTGVANTTCWTNNSASPKGVLGSTQYRGSCSSYICRKQFETGDTRACVESQLDLLR